MNAAWREGLAKKLDKRSDAWSEAASKIKGQAGPSRRARAMLLYFAQEASECAGEIRNTQSMEPNG